ncbi:hypothetical protein [Bifidobacterium crudilactis]|jgi:hypothetical protein|uniref:hypothetical protein n=1 Tax=Bifidobacterium crudilactis TaxID=327277 RepID=UPI002F35D970
MSRPHLFEDEASIGAFYKRFARATMDSRETRGLLFEYFIDRIFVGDKTLTIASWFFDGGQAIALDDLPEAKQTGEVLNIEFDTSPSGGARESAKILCRCLKVQAKVWTTFSFTPPITTSMRTEQSMLMTRDCFLNGRYGMPPYTQGRLIARVHCSPMVSCQLSQAPGLRQTAVAAASCPSYFDASQKKAAARRFLVVVVTVGGVLVVSNMRFG